MLIWVIMWLMLYTRCLMKMVNSITTESIVLIFISVIEWCLLKKKKNKQTKTNKQHILVPSIYGTMDPFLLLVTTPFFWLNLLIQDSFFPVCSTVFNFNNTICCPKLNITPVDRELIKPFALHVSILIQLLTNETGKRKLLNCSNFFAKYASLKRFKC